MSAEITSYAEQMLMGRIHAKSDSFARNLEFAKNGIEATLKIAPRCYVGISFGKQSICMAHLVQSIRSDIPMFFLASTETWALYDYAEVIEDYCSRFSPNLTIVQTDRLSGAKDWKGARDAGDQDLQNMCKRGKWDGWFWGLSVDESKARKITIKKGVAQNSGHPSIYRYSDGKHRCCPIMNWGIKDLAAYISLHDLRVLNIYRKYGLTQRTTARITKKMVGNDGMALARQTSGGQLRKLMNEFPEVKVT